MCETLFTIDKLEMLYVGKIIVDRRTKKLQNNNLNYLNLINI